MMGKHVKATLIGANDSFTQRMVSEGYLTVGATYEAYLPEDGEFDPNGDAVFLRDELWITQDDTGEPIITDNSFGDWKLEDA